jgi:hypothetical protein
MPRPRNTPEVLWSKVDKRGQDECWPWLGWRNSQGYGRFEIDGKSYYAHRAIFALANPGSVELSAPPSRYAHGFMRHKCDNPSCCNPTHLLVGTHTDNMRDKVERGRSKWFESSVDSPRAKLSDGDVRTIRNLKKHGYTYKALQAMFGVSKATITGVLSGRHYADVI